MLICWGCAGQRAWRQLSVIGRRTRALAVGQYSRFGSGTAHFAGAFEVTTIWSPTFSAVNFTLSPGFNFASAAASQATNDIVIGPMLAFGISSCFSVAVFAVTETLRTSPSTGGAAAIAGTVARLDLTKPTQRRDRRAPPQEGDCT